MDESTAIARLKAGDIGGLEYLVHRYQVQAIRIANLVTRNPSLAEDIVQDCFIRVGRSIRTFDESRRFAPWFYKGVLREAVKAVQRQDRQKSYDPTLDAEWFEREVGSAESTERTVENRLLAEKVSSALARLSPRQRMVIIQRYYLDMSAQDMAVEGGTTVGTVKWLLHAARNQLRAVLIGKED